MKCPNCDVNLVMTDRNGVEIDYCPECRGIWLDRGELDKIIERSSQAVSSSKSNDNFRQNQHYSDQKSHGTKKKTSESFLSDLFDF
jgi:Zn-finger nucleic acid-binding protein